MSLKSLSLIAVIALSLPLSASAQCGPGGYGGWVSGPGQIGQSPFGFEYQNESGQDWGSIPHGDEVDFYPGDLFAQAVSFLVPVANAQCGYAHDNPVATLAASPATINSGDSSTLTWSSENVTSCTGTGFSTDGATSGSVSVSPSQTTTYSVSCTGPDGNASDNETVTVKAGGPLEVSCSANPNPQSVNASVIWHANVSGDQGPYTYSWSGSEGLSGSASSVSKSYATTGTKTASVTVTGATQAVGVACTALEVENPIEPQCSDGINNNGTGGTDYPDDPACSSPEDETEDGTPPSTLSCTVDSQVVDVGGRTTYHAVGASGPYDWSQTGQTGCSGGANNSCAFPEPGDYSMTVDAPGVDTPALCPFVKAGCAGNPAADISADRVRVNVGETVTLSWTASGVLQSTCVLSGPGINEIIEPNACMLDDSMETPAIKTQSVYTIDCGEDATASVIVNVASDLIEF